MNPYKVLNPKPEATRPFFHPARLSERLRKARDAYQASGDHAHSVLYYHVVNLVEVAERTRHASPMDVLIEGTVRLNQALSDANKRLLDMTMKVASPPMILMTQGGPLTAGTTLTPPKVAGKPLATVSAPKLPRDRGQDGRP